MVLPSITDAFEFTTRKPIIDDTSMSNSLCEVSLQCLLSEHRLQRLGDRYLNSTSAWYASRASGRYTARAKRVAQATVVDPVLYGV